METKRHTVMVWFATSSTYRPVGGFDVLEQAERRSREYIGADARGVKIVHLDGSETIVVSEQGIW